MNDIERKWWINQLRRVYAKTGRPAECIRKQCTGKKDGRAYIYTCEKCGGEFKKKELQADHKKPVINPTTGFVDWNEFISRLNVTLKGLQCLCKKCHSEKSAKENKKRRK